jgi:CRP-like cAMP-binding protein
VTIVADTKTYAELLRDIPALSSCDPDLLHRFVTEVVLSVHTAAGREIRSRFDSSGNLFVLVGGSAFLDAGDDVGVALEPGDYFGGDSAHHDDNLTMSVVAEEDSEVLVITPEQVVQLQQAGPRRRHPSNADWSPEVAVPSLRLLPSRRRLAVLARAGS